MNDSQKKFYLRLRWLSYIIIPAIALLLLLNLFHIQVQNGTQFREQADNQYVVASYNAFERGSIYFEDRNQELVTAAGQKKGYKLSVNTQNISDPEEFYESLAKIIEIPDKTSLIDKLNSGRSYQELVNQLSVQEAKDIKKALGSKVQLHSEKWRVYPLGEAAAHVLGFLAYQEDDYAGRYGLERFYESTLIRNNKDLYTNFFARVFHGVQNLVDSDLDFEGDIVSSIDPQIQIYLEAELSDIQESWSSETTGGIIIHPQTGAIYAMGAVPSFDPNDFSESSASVFRNPLIENVYEMGSIIKPLVVASAWDSGDINERTTYQDTGSVVVGKHTIYNFDKKGRGLVDVQEILNQSLNTGMVYISKRISKENFREYFSRYGFGEQTGIDLPNEGKGLTSNLDSNRDIEFANISFGQGLAISPMSVTKAISALANKGKTVKPHIVKRINYENGFFNTIEDTEGKQVIKEETASEISRMLVNVFDAYNDGRTKIEHYSVAAKTGTAQIPAPDGGYYDDRNLHSFFGYFPAYDPEFLVFLYTVHPKGVRYSSQTLLNPFRDIAQYLINYYDVPPDR